MFVSPNIKTTGSLTRIENDIKKKITYISLFLI